MKKVFPLACLPVLTLCGATACIHDDNADCHFNYAVEVSIQDKNYDNIGQFPQLPREDEGQPFGHFSGTIYYVLTDAKTQQNIHQSEIISISAKSTTYSIAFDNLPEGEYNLAAWGNLTADAPAGTLHPKGAEHADVYAGATQFSISDKNVSTSKVEMKRTKGKLLVFCNNFPSNIVRMHQSLTNVYGQADAALNYNQPTSVEKDSPLWEVNSLWAAPTQAGQASQLNLSFYATGLSAPVLTVPNLTLNINRNKLSAVTVDYDSVSGSWNIWVYADGEWTLLHHLTIE